MDIFTPSPPYKSRITQGIWPWVILLFCVIFHHHFHQSEYAREQIPTPY
ncbi:MAG: DUF2933 domain-containing protein [Anaerotruncus sp.]|nr:DUF2933 domain-containing protein [Anaerotruncus sp.]